MGKRLYVGNLSYNATEADLRDLFAESGNVTDMKVVLDRETGRIMKMYEPACATLVESRLKTQNEPVLLHILTQNQPSSLLF